jgi:hypothetical protein
MKKEKRKRDRERERERERKKKKKKKKKKNIPHARSAANILTPDPYSIEREIISS